MEATTKRRCSIRALCTTGRSDFADFSRVSFQQAQAIALIIANCRPGCRRARRAELPGSLRVGTVCVLTPESTKGLASQLQPTINPRPWTASSRNITPSDYTRDRAEFGAVRIANPASNDMRDAEPCGGYRQWPSDSGSWDAQKKPC